MPRPKRGTEAGERATEAWRATMKSKYGDISGQMAKVGRKGGVKGRTGGFWYKKYVEHDDAFVSNMGRIGGSRSRRGSKSEG